MTKYYLYSDGRIENEDGVIVKPAQVIPDARPSASTTPLPATTTALPPLSTKGSLVRILTFRLTVGIDMYYLGAWKEGCGRAQITHF